jgi:hypothetical protein
LFGDVIVLEVLKHVVGGSRRDVEPKAWAQVVDQRVGDDLGLAGGQEGFPAGTGRKLLDLVRTQVVQEAGRIGAGRLDLAPVRNVKESGLPAGAFVLGRGIAEMRGHEPAGLFREYGSGLHRGRIQRRLFGHETTLLAGLALLFGPILEW